MKTTIIKHYRGYDTLKTIELEEIVGFIRDGAYRAQVATFRRTHQMSGRDNPDGVPSICFALEQGKQHGERVVKAYTGLVLLEVNNLTGRDEAEAVRSGAGEMPQTLLAFVGAEGKSVKIVCRGEYYPKDAEREGAPLPKSEEDIALFHENLYERARITYNGQLGITVERLEPTPQRDSPLSYDAGIVYNPLATPFLARAEKASETLRLGLPQLERAEEESIDYYLSQHNVFEFNMTKAYDEVQGIDDREEYVHALLSRLAAHCLQTEIPMATAVRQATMKPEFWERRELVRKVFENTYREEHVRRYQERRATERRLLGVREERRTSTIPPETLLTMKVNIFLNTNYELRRNVMRGVAEYRHRTGMGYSFSDLTAEARNSITMRALEQGIRCWDKDIQRYVNSEDIMRYDPMNEYLERLPRWDGKDRVTPLAERIPTEWAEWTHLFHIWMRSMVAMWLGKGQLTGNALVPLLIGRQGCGKSSFCHILLPRELQDYYNDRINFKNEQDLNLGLTSFGLINLDEFDRVTQRQQVVLKYLVSTASLKYRPPYGKAYTSNRRYASFIGTTNEPAPLTDPTGSRRFLCVSINGDIDFETPVQHDQLYAQLFHEVNSGERYWLTREEEKALMEHNLQYQRLNGLGEMLMAILQRPRPGEEGEWKGLKEISALLKSRFRGYREDASSFQKIGSYLSRPEYKFQSRRPREGTEYLVKLRV